jgi:hypothetical protein
LLHVFKDILPADYAFLVINDQMQEHLPTIALDPVSAQNGHCLRVFGAEPKIAVKTDGKPLAVVLYLHPT